MTLGRRFLFYLGGFAVGLILLFFFVGGSGASCGDYAYGPNARVLKNIRNKDRVLLPTVLEELNKYELDTSAITAILVSGNVNFKESNTKLDSCKQYRIDGQINQYELQLRIENCDSLARVLQLIVD